MKPNWTEAASRKHDWLTRPFTPGSRGAIDVGTLNAPGLERGQMSSNR
jgi:hypothetical protein